MPRGLFTLLLTASLCLASCGHKAHWLRGKWVFDAEHTKEMLARTERQQPKPEGLVEGLKEIASGLVTPQLISALEGSQLNVTSKELIMTTKDGNGKAFAYEVVDRPDADTLTLKTADGEVTTYHREG